MLGLAWRDVARPPVLAGLLLHIFCSALALVALPMPPAGAQDGAGIVRRGDAVVTGFAGAKPPGADLPADVHPLDQTYIDPDGITARVLDLSRLGGGPQGQLADAPTRRALRAREIGHVFGIAFDGDGRDGPPNVYFAATAMHGLQLVMPPARPGEKPQRILQGRPGATWAPNLFGPGGGPGSIWRVDGRTGEARLLADIRNGDRDNNGAGLGGLAFDPVTRTLLASDLETGLVWRVGLDGRILDTFDHGTEGRMAAGLDIVPYDPALRVENTDPTFSTESPDTWGFADARRRVFGLAVEGGRLYYGVAEGPQIWSVSIDQNGGFGTDARREIEVAGAQNAAAIGAIVFDGPQVMYVAERGPPLGNYDYAAFMRPQEARVLRYQWREAEGRWAAAPDEYAVGLAPEHRATVGGVALNYGYDRLGNMDYGRCRETVWSTGEHLRAAGDIVQVSRGGARHVNGLQGVWKPRVRPANEPPNEAWFVDYDGRFEDPEAHGHVGNVAIFGPCAEGRHVTTADVVVPVWEKGANLVVDKRCRPAAAGGVSECRITVKNIGDGPAGGLVEIVEQVRVLGGATVGAAIRLADVRPDADTWLCEVDATGNHVCRIPGEHLGPGVERFVDVVVDTRGLIADGSAGFRNCVTLRHGAGSGRVCAEGGADIVVKKTGPLECLPGAPCSYEITITNAGDDPWSGPVAIADQLTVAGKVVPVAVTEISPPLGCGVEPAALPFACAANVTLAPGESRKHRITIAAPAAPGAWLENCVTAADPWVLGEAPALAKLLKPAKTKSTSAEVVAACHWTKVPAPAQGQIALPLKAPPVPPAIASGWVAEPIGLLPLPPVCADGRSPLPSGRCPCPAHAPYNPETGTCGWRPPVCWDQARLTPSGECCPWGTVWHPWRAACAAPIREGCRDPWRRTPDGSCCPGGTRWIDGACRRPVVLIPCAPDEVRLFNGQCIRIARPWPTACPVGMRRLANGVCAPLACPSGRIDPRTGRCEAVARPVPPVAPRCPGRLVPDARGHCVPPVIGSSTTPAPVPIPLPVPGSGPRRCPGNLVLSERGVCVPPGTASGGTPPPTPRPTPPGKTADPVQPGPGGCPPNLVRNQWGACAPPGSPGTGVPPGRPPAPGKTADPVQQPPCPGRLVRNPQGVCVVPGTAGTQRPPPGGADRQPCGPGQVRSAAGQCVPIGGNQGRPCPPGHQRTDAGQCVRSAQTVRCAPGQRLVNGACVGGRVEAPKREVPKAPPRVERPQPPKAPPRVQRREPRVLVRRPAGPQQRTPAKGPPPKRSNQPR